jgi:hypothetical protein
MTVDNRYDGRGYDPPFPTLAEDNAMLVKDNQSLTARLAATEAAVEGMTSECVYCHDVLDPNGDLDHWETCTEHPARQRLAAAEARVTTLEGHLDWIGWSSDGIGKARSKLAATGTIS